MREWLFAVAFMAVSSQAQAQRVVEHEQVSFPEEIPAGGYSGVAWLGDDRYAVVSDNTPKDGFFIFSLSLDSLGAIRSARNLGFYGNSAPGGDSEGVAWWPVRGTLFVSGEKANQVHELRMDGSATGRHLRLPAEFARATSSYGLEALTYDAVAHRFWTTSESTLTGDGKKADAINGVRNKLRLQSFDDRFMPRQQYVYEMDEAMAESQPERYALGVSALAAVGDGSLMVLEREFAVLSSKIGSFASCKIYRVWPSKGKALPAGAPIGGVKPLEKSLVAEWMTSIGLLDFSIANYEGMCIGPRLADGGRVVVLLADSQNQYGGILADWWKTFVIYDE